ncbi:MAG: hypothetical protein QOG23_3535 [Blastocatellia bacterium]|nr:hypothetical protein [Blastocatellia bacterium]
MSSIVAIVPRLLPVVDGVGDYALRLARGLQNDFGLETQFSVGDPRWSGPDRVEEFAVTRLRERTVGHLPNALPAESRATLLLHYGGYAYAARLTSVSISLSRRAVPLMNWFDWLKERVHIHSVTRNKGHD